MDVRWCVRTTIPAKKTNVCMFLAHIASTNQTVRVSKGTTERRPRFARKFASIENVMTRHSSPHFHRHVALDMALTEVSSSITKYRVAQIEHLRRMMQMRDRRTGVGAMFKVHLIITWLEALKKHLAEIKHLNERTGTIEWNDHTVGTVLSVAYACGTLSGLEGVYLHNLDRVVELMTSLWRRDIDKYTETRHMIRLTRSARSSRSSRYVDHTLLPSFRHTLEEGYMVLLDNLVRLYMGLPRTDGHDDILWRPPSPSSVSERFYSFIDTDSEDG